MTPVVARGRIKPSRHRCCIGLLLLNNALFSAAFALRIAKGYFKQLQTRRIIHGT